MNLKNQTLLLCSFFLTISSAELALAKKRDVGAIAGAIIGGIIGNELGGKNDKGLSTGLGIIVGAVIGNEIGRELDDSDRRAMAEAQRRAFDRPYGERVTWDGANYGSRTRSHGEFRTIRQGYMRNSRMICREYESIIVTSRKTTVKKGIACSQTDGRWTESRYEDVDFNDYVRPSEPNYPNTPYYPERPSYNDSLSGYCQDYNHDNFYAAKEFAQDYSSGLGMFTSQATEWAMDYNRTHRCNTIQEYKRRFKAIYSFATDYSNGLGQFTAQARTMASQWVDNNCEGVDTIERMKQAYTREYQFATSYRGLGMMSSEARKYALRQIRPLTRCSDILRIN